MEISPVAFYIFASIAIAFSAMVVFKRNPVSSAFSLVVVFFCFAAIYALLGAHLIATLQILVYTGAVMVLFVFVIMLLKEDSPSFDLIGKSSPFNLLTSVVTLVLLTGFFVFVFKNAPVFTPMGQFTPAVVESLGGNTQIVSELMFSQYLLPFELTSVLLLAVLVGVVAIAMRKNRGEK